MTLARPVYVNDELSAVIGIDILIEKMDMFLDQLSFTENTKIMIYTDDFILSSNLRSEESRDILKWINSSINDRDVTIDVSDYLVRRQQVGFRSAFRLAMCAYYSEKRVDKKQAILAHQNIIIVAVIILIIGLLLIVLNAFSISKPLQTISQHIQSINRLDLQDTIQENSGIQELYFLQKHLNTMQKSLNSFSHYIPKKVVKLLLSENKEAKIDGEQKMVTMFFSDIENFCEYAERKSPKELAQQLALYFDVLSQLVINKQGTIDKYIGDSIMAFWGAPTQINGHENKAVESVIEMMDVLASKSNDRDALFKNKTRFALHTGEVVVGNIGSNERFNYSIMGNNVNICSRLESLNKRYGTQALISDTTYQNCTLDVVTRPLDCVRLKGLSNPIQIHQLVSFSQKKYMADIDDF